jgi:hypothetical protein
MFFLLMFLFESHGDARPSFLVTEFVTAPPGAAVDELAQTLLDVERPSRTKSSFCNSRARLREFDAPANPNFSFGAAFVAEPPGASAVPIDELEQRLRVLHPRNFHQLSA